MNTVWEQGYYVLGQGLWVSAAIAAIPTVVLLYLLAVKRKPSWVASLTGLGMTLIVALIAYRMPVKLALSSAAHGAAFGLFPISWIVFWAIVLYNVTVQTGKFAIIKDSIGSLTSDLRLQAIIIAFGFGAFIEGAAGFGTPIAVAGAMMVGLGFSPYFAAALCLLANTAPVAFGSIGLPVITLAGVTGLPLDKLSGAVGRLCAPISLILPAYLIVTMGGWASALEIWPALLVAGVTFAAVQFIVSNYIGVQLTVILSSLASMGAIVALLQFWQPKSKAATKRMKGAERGPFEMVNSTSSLAQTKYTTGETIVGWMPYIFLVVFVLLWSYKPVQSVLNVATFALRWPALHNLILRTPPVVPAPTLYPAIFNLNMLSAAGTSCMFATFLTVIFLRMPLTEFGRVVAASARQLTFPILTISAVLSLAFVMNYSGATGTLGLAFSATGASFPFFSPFLGWLGVFLTGSDTSANALFGSLQVVTARHLGFSPILIAASNSSGGVMGKMISLQSIAVAAAATGITVQQQSKLLRFTLRHSIQLALLVGFQVLIYAYWVHVL
ncbi:MAG TPA: lactate permease LctP family transporter [Acidobacteriaceae bacterium]|nr:lactate permease LctP family transporter [Acidobacteriaceae bacterium]